MKENKVNNVDTNKEVDDSKELKVRFRNDKNEETILEETKLNPEGESNFFDVHGCGGGC